RISFGELVVVKSLSWNTMSLLSPRRKSIATTPPYCLGGWNGVWYCCNKRITIICVIVCMSRCANTISNNISPCDNNIHTIDIEGYISDFHDWRGTSAYLESSSRNHTGETCQGGCYIKARCCSDVCCICRDVQI